MSASSNVRSVFTLPRQHQICILPRWRVGARQGPHVLFGVSVPCASARLPPLPHPPPLFFFFLCYLLGEETRRLVLQKFHTSWIGPVAFLRCPFAGFSIPIIPVRRMLIRAPPPPLPRCFWLFCLTVVFRIWLFNLTRGHNWQSRMRETVTSRGLTAVLRSGSAVMRVLSPSATSVS